ncbi:hypothetical protein ACWCY6_39895 [Streptomyces sp. 900105755]
MTEGNGPAITGLHHLFFTVTNLEDSLDWYKRVFRAEQVDCKVNHLYRERTGYGILLVVPESGPVIGLHSTTGNRHEDSSKPGQV